ncbi:MAG: iron-containing alcohol dehydrogenase [Aestuariivita sp.]|nr:iron-containing alcohol dehydrogenase [Aestuariivita sp.]
MTPFIFSTTKSLVFEPGASARIAEIVGKTLGQTTMVITDPSLRTLGMIDAALISLESAGHTLAIFDDVESDPSRDTLMSAVEFGKNAGVTGVVGFGGGSPMDVAKLTALLLGSGEDLDDAWGVAQAKGPRLPLVLVPTTAGTGSEVTPVSIITVGTEEKRGVSSSILLPDVAILDAELTARLPADVTAATGVDAMVHAIEAYTSKSTNNNPLSKILAREALRLLGANIETAVFDGHNMQARSAMLLGSMLAGQAFANSPVAAVHALAYPIGGTFHVPHGLSNALILPHVLRFNACEAGALYAEIASDPFPHLATIETDQDRCDAFIDALAHLSRKLGMKTRLRDVNIPADTLSKMAADAMQQTRLLVNNPRALSETDAVDIYKAAW